MKIYVASSWRNQYQPHAIVHLRNYGHEVYDFRNPPNGTGFGWGQIDPYWKSWTMEEYIAMLKHPIAIRGFESDMQALNWADGCLLVQPCGRSAHLELGYMVGQGKKTCVLLADGEPELMIKMVDKICTSMDEVLSFFKEHK